MVFLVWSSESCYWLFWSQQCLYHIAAQRKYIVLVKWKWTLCIIGRQDLVLPLRLYGVFPFSDISFIRASRKHHCSSMLVLFLIFWNDFSLPPPPLPNLCCHCFNFVFQVSSEMQCLPCLCKSLAKYLYLFPYLLKGENEKPQNNTLN